MNSALKASLRPVLAGVALLAGTACVSVDNAGSGTQPALTIEGTWNYELVNMTFTITNENGQWTVTGLYDSRLTVADASARHIHLVWGPSAQRREDLVFELSGDGQILTERYVVTVLEDSRKQQGTGTTTWRRVRK